jgi:hypothetical protein
MTKILNGVLNFKNNTLPTISNQVKVGRVKYTILNDKDNEKIFNDYGQWSSIGAIFFEDPKNPTNSKLDNNNIAYPLMANIKNYPLKNEIVYILSLPSNKSQSNINSVVNYYLQPINIWNSTNHNAIPDSVFDKDKINLGNTFQESLIRSLQPFEGDVTFEGRFGQGIRFGSTTENSSIKNTWSSNGENGAPITIIHNGQYEDTSDPWVPQIEDINKNKSSIYLTDTQRIELEASSINYNSYNSKPISIDKYTNPQIIINSGRVVLNSYEDSVLISSNKSVNLNSNESLNIDTKESILNSEKIYLGDKDADQALLLGNDTIASLEKILKEVSKVMDALSQLAGVQQGSPFPTLVQSATPAKKVIDIEIRKLKKLLSKRNFTK